jgi:hypothetical protein
LQNIPDVGHFRAGHFAGLFLQIKDSLSDLSFIITEIFTARETAFNAPGCESKLISL